MSNLEIMNVVLEPTHRFVGKDVDMSRDMHNGTSWHPKAKEK
jgi:hypothetical protein